MPRPIKTSVRNHGPKTMLPLGSTRVWEVEPRKPVVRLWSLAVKYSSRSPTTVRSQLVQWVVFSIAAGQVVQVALVLVAEVAPAAGTGVALPSDGGASGGGGGGVMPGGNGPSTSQ